MAQLPYDKRDYNSIFNYLCDRAKVLSGGRWTDFSDADVGTLIIKLMSFLADMNNYQIDKATSELYLDTLLERESALSLMKLIGYNPRGYESAVVKLNLSITAGQSIPDGTIIPRYTQWTDATGSVSFYNIDEYQWLSNVSNVIAYEGNYIRSTYGISNITDNNRLYMSANDASATTFTVTVSGVRLKRIDNVLTDVSGDLCYSVHIDTDSSVYIQLPANWGDFIVEGTPITVEYLRTRGTNGRIGSDIISRVVSSNMGISDNYIIVTNTEESVGGFDPETIEEMQVSAPIYASTMDTLVTLEDIELIKAHISGISDIVALDYNTPESGLVQPVDAYKVKVYALPTTSDIIVDSEDNLTDVGLELKEYIDRRRLTSIQIIYENVTITTPQIKINVYINQFDTRKDSVGTVVKNIILNKYSRENGFGIGDSIYSSDIAKAILDEVDYSKYIEVVLPADSYSAGPAEFLSIIPDNVIVNVYGEWFKC